MKRGLFILLFLFLNLLYGQITYQKPDTNLILRANNQFEVASLLIDSDVAFFEKAKKELINGYQVYHLEIQVPDAKYLNIYFDVLKINQNSVLEIYNNQNDLVLNITSSSKDRKASFNSVNIDTPLYSSSKLSFLETIAVNILFDL